MSALSIPPQIHLYVLRKYDIQDDKIKLVSTRTVEASCVSEVVAFRYGATSIKNTTWGRKSARESFDLKIKISQHNCKTLNFYANGHLQFSIERVV